MLALSALLSHPHLVKLAVHCETGSVRLCAMPLAWYVVSPILACLRGEQLWRATL